MQVPPWFIYSVAERAFSTLEKVMNETGTNAQVHFDYTLDHGVTFWHQDGTQTAGHGPDVIWTPASTASLVSSVRVSDRRHPSQFTLIAGSDVDRDPITTKPVHRPGLNH